MNTALVVFEFLDQVLLPMMLDKILLTLTDYFSVVLHQLVSMKHVQPYLDLRVVVNLVLEVVLAIVVEGLSDFAAIEFRV